jgi:hypothetical protein
MATQSTNDPIANSIEFTNSLHNILNLLDTITDLLPEGIYLQICNELKLANSNANKRQVIVQYIDVERQRINNNPIVVHHIKMSRPDRKKLQKRTDAQKLANGWKMCHHCNRLVTNLWRHQNETDVCSRVERVKKIVAIKQDVEISELIILANKVYNIYWECRSNRKDKYYNNERFADKCWSGYFGKEVYMSIVG